MMPREVWDRVAPLIPVGGALAVARANHPGRFLSLVVGEQGELRAFVKIARDSIGSEALRRERWALETLGALLPHPLFAPRVLDHEEGVLVLEPVEWRVRSQPWKLDPEVAYALGRFFRATATASDGSTGAWHGDCTPWNLLRAERGWALVDWENAETDKPAFFDVFHFLVQASVELRRPTKGSIIRGLEQDGWVGASIRAYGNGADIDLREAASLFSEYLRKSLRALDPSTPGRAVRIRRNLSRRLRSRKESEPDKPSSPATPAEYSRRKGLLILIVGPDGSGKSSLASRLVSSAHEDGRPVRHIHWRPALLPYADTLGGPSPNPSRPHGRDAHSRPLSFLRVVYYWVDFFVGLRLRALPVRNHGGLLVIERGWWDLAVDPLRYRLNVQPGLIERLGNLLPRPDLVICLEAPPGVLAERKQELPKSELDRQMKAWRRIRLPTRIVRVNIDASQALQRVMSEAEKHVKGLLAR
jgi:hypothetical protein